MRTAKQVRDQIDALYYELKEIQEYCLHPFQEGKNKTGYGYGTESEYWTEVTCLECGLKWIEDQ